MFPSMALSPSFNITVTTSATAEKKHNMIYAFLIAFIGTESLPDTIDAYHSAETLAILSNAILCHRRNTRFLYPRQLTK
jgi:hypothetical protein